MTERESGDDRDYPDGSVGRYVREQWGAAPARTSKATRPYVGPVQPVPDPVEPDVDPDEQDAGGAPPVVNGQAVPGRIAGPPLQAPPARPAPPTAAMAPEHAPSTPPGWSPPPMTGPQLVTPQPAGLQYPGGYHTGGQHAAGQYAGGQQVGGHHAGGGSQPPAAPPGVRSSGSWAVVAPSSVPDGASRLPPAPPGPRSATDSPPRGTAGWTDPVAVAAQEAQHARSGYAAPDRQGTDLSSARLLRQGKRPPQSGWRRMVYVLSGRLLNPGESPSDIRRRELTARVNQPLLGCYKIAMLSLKGGVGKTTVTATLGATFASLRGDRVVAVDANPDRGTLSQKIPLETSATVRNLLRDAQRVRRYTDVRAYTSQGASRLEVLASEQDPAVSEAFSEDDYRRTVTLLEHFYNIVLTDCGTGLMHSAMYGVLGVADQLIIVSSGSIDGARSASATMDWLEAHGHGDLVANSVAVINCVHRSAGGVDLNRVAEHFEARCRTVVRVPFDAHLEEGAEVDLDRLEPGTRLALLELAAAVADAFEGAPTA